METVLHGKIEKAKIGTTKDSYTEMYPIEKSSDEGLSHEIIPSLRIHIRRIKKYARVVVSVWLR